MLDTYLAPPMAAQQMFSQWRGRWHLHRHVHNFADEAMSGSAFGTACIYSPAPTGEINLVHYQETALFLPQSGSCIEVRRGFAYRLDARTGVLQACVLALFDNKESCLHELWFATPSAGWEDAPLTRALYQAKGGYVCGADRYEVCYLFYGDAKARLSRVKITYRVQGPCKNYQTDTELTPVSAANLPQS